MTKKSYFKCLLLDLDGTLIDSKRLVVKAVQHCARAKGRRRIPPYGKVKKFFNKSPNYILEKFRLYNVDDFWEYYEQHIGRIKLYDRRLRSKLQKLKREKVRIGLVSSLSRKMGDLVLDYFNLGNVFHTCQFFRRGYNKSKLIKRALRKLGIKPENTLYVGDLPKDIEAAEGADIWSGVAFWGINRWTDFNDFEPDFVFNNLNQIIELFMAKLSRKKNVYAPDEKCYLPHNQYLHRRKKISRLACFRCHFPTDCLNCKRFGRLRWVSPKFRFFQKLQSRKLLNVKSAEHYLPKNVKASDDVSKVLRAFKNGDQQYEVRMGLSMVKYLRELQLGYPIFRNIDLILPVPASKERKKKAGYNPPEELSKVIGVLSKININSKVLDKNPRFSMRKIRYTLPYEKRVRKQYDNIYIRNKRLVEGKRILIVDDVLTDGTTIVGIANKLYDSCKIKPRILALTFGCTKKIR